MSRTRSSRNVATLLALSLCALALLPACGEEPPPPPPSKYDFPLEVKVSDSLGNPLPRVPVVLGENVVGFTDKDGEFIGTVKEEEGASLTIGVQPMQGYRFTDEPTVTDQLRITRIGGPAQPVPVSLNVTAESLKADYFFWISAQCDETLAEGSCAGLPVLLDGEKVAETNREGYAHFSLTRVPETELELSLETPEYDPKDEEGQLMEPRNPTFELTLDLQPHVYLIEETFMNPIAKEEKKKTKKRRSRSTRRRKPRRKASPPPPPKKEATKKKPAKEDDGVIDLW